MNQQEHKFDFHCTSVLCVVFTADGQNKEDLAECLKGESGKKGIALEFKCCFTNISLFFMKSLLILHRS